jgi:hypothetical protein
MLSVSPTAASENGPSTPFRIATATLPLDPALSWSSSTATTLQVDDALVSASKSAGLMAVPFATAHTHSPLTAPSRSARAAAMELMRMAARVLSRPTPTATELTSFKPQLAS